MILVNGEPLTKKVVNFNLEGGGVRTDSWGGYERVALIFADENGTRTTEYVHPLVFQVLYNIDPTGIISIRFPGYMTTWGRTTS